MSAPPRDEDDLATTIPTRTRKGPPAMQETPPRPHAHDGDFSAVVRSQLPQPYALARALAGGYPDLRPRRPSRS